MSAIKRCKVEVKKDHLTKIATGSPEYALAELVWNSLDADATVINVNFHENPLNEVDRITIADNGVGIPYVQVESLFVALGGSWKAAKDKTDMGRYLHGKDGAGRFKAFVLGRIIEWKVKYKENENLKYYSISGRGDSLDEFILSDERATESSESGVEVQISELSRKFHLLDKDKAIDRLTPIFALYLSNYPNINLNIEGTHLDPNEVIKTKKSILLDPILKDNIDYQIELEIIEWTGLKEREVWFCDQNGFPLEIYNRRIRGVGDFGFSAYLKSELFSNLKEEGTLSLGDLNTYLNKISDQAIKEIKEYFLKRTLESNKDRLKKWKEEKVYPYEDEPISPIEVAERQVFDIVAINIDDTLPDSEHTDNKSKAFQFRMLKQALEKSPHDLQLIIDEVLQLPKKKQEQLAELLKDATLSGIISASKLVADRLKFISGLEIMLFDDDIKKHLKERSQLHRILAENTWIFGHAFSLSVDDKSLTDVLRKHLKHLKIKMVIDKPVKRLDDKVGIIDLMLSRSIPRNHSNELEHLVVELKAPRVKIGEKEIQQIKRYAFAVAKDERFKGLETQWHFWVISNDIDEFAEMELSQERYEEGVIFKSIKDINLTIWVKTWSQLIQENKHRLEFIRDKLNYNIDRKDALTYLKKTYAEYTEGINLSEAGQPHEDRIEDAETVL